MDVISLVRCQFKNKVVIRLSVSVLSTRGKVLNRLYAARLWNHGYF